MFKTLQTKFWHTLPFISCIPTSQSQYFINQQFIYIWLVIFNKKKEFFIESSVVLFNW